MKHGEFTHVDIPADDPARARQFYSELFGWTFQDVGFGDFQIATTPAGETGVGGGIGKRGETAPEVVRVYVHVDSIDETIERAKALGAKVVVEKASVGPTGSYAALADSEGNEIGLWEDAPGAPNA